MKAHYDVLVAGGGLSGVGAAVAAAREGKNVLLIERFGCLGGAACHNLVNPFMLYWRDVNGEKELLNRGVFERIVGDMRKQNAILDDGKFFHEEYLKFVLDNLVKEYGITVLFHTNLIAAKAENGKVQSVTLVNKSGVFEIQADMYIDATGDGDLAARAGFAYAFGDENGYCQPMTLCFKLGGVPYGDMSYFDVRKVVNGLYKEYQAQGKIKNPREDVLIFKSVLPNVLHFNSTRVIKKSAINAEDITAAEMQAREQMFELIDFLKNNNFELFKDCYLIESAPCIGVRESRRITGEYTVTADDILSCTKFADGIARGNYPIDVHNPSGSGTVLKKIPPHEYYTVPLGACIPKGSKNLFVAGRCISATHEAQASFRVMPIVCCIGEGVGTAAAVALQSGVNADQVDVARVHEIMDKNGALY